DSRVDKLIEMYRSNQARACGLYYLNENSVSFELGGRTWKAYGSPWSPRFGDMAFNYLPGEEADIHVGKIPEDIDILLTHCPPRGILDTTHEGISAGCPSLARKVNDCRPKIHAFG
ncbi:hypothetical protein DL93DRAFT_2035371, partial [Clavulina sp. PMI_390]